MKILDEVMEKETYKVAKHNKKSPNKKNKNKKQGGEADPGQVCSLKARHSSQASGATLPQVHHKG